MFRNSLSASQSKPAPESFSFPMLKGSEILQCMSELNVPLTEADLMEPEKNKANIRRAMFYLIELCTGVTRDSLATPAFAGLQVRERMTQAEATPERGRGAMQANGGGGGNGDDMREMRNCDESDTRVNTDACS